MVVPVPVGTVGTVGMVVPVPVGDSGDGWDGANVSVRSAQLFLYVAAAHRGSIAAAGLSGCGARGQGSSINHQRRTGGGPGVLQASPSERLKHRHLHLRERLASAENLQRLHKQNRRRLRSRRRTDHRLDMSHPQGERLPITALTWNSCVAEFLPGFGLFSFRCSELTLTR